MKHKPSRPTKDSAITRENDRQAGSWQSRIREVMVTKGMSQRKLARLAGLGSTSVRHAVTKADTITIESMRRIANAMNVPLAYLATGTAVVVEDQSETSPDMPKQIIILPVHGAHEEPGLDHGRGSVAVSAWDVGTAPYALEMGDNSMVGTGSNYPPDPADVVLAEDVVIYDTDTPAEPGMLVVVDTGAPKYTVRLLEYDEGDYYAAALTRSYGRIPIELDDVLGVVKLTTRGRRL